MAVAKKFSEKIRSLSIIKMEAMSLGSFVVETIG